MSALPTPTLSDPLADKLSGVVINQNQKPSPADWIAPAGRVYQEFYLPTNYARGTDSERVVPPLSGFALMVGTTSNEINVEWSVEYQVFGIGWIPLNSGVEGSAAYIGSRVWINVNFPTLVEVPEEALENRWRIGIKANQGIDRIWYSRPNPLELPHHAKVTKADGYTSFGSPAFSFLFRVLALAADSGTDFLGNTYRSAVNFNKPDNVSTIDGSEDGYWLSKPNPSRFAVENLYYDLRPLREQATYGATNLVTNPSFEVAASPWVVDDDGSASPTTSSPVLVTTDQAESGAQSGTVLHNSGGTYTGISISNTSRIPVKAGKPYSLGGSIMASAGQNVAIYIQWWDSLTGGNILSTPNTTVMAVDGWNRLKLENQVAPAGAVAARLYLRAFGPSDGTNAYFDSVIFQQTTSIPGYFDGDSFGYTWTGVRHASTSVEVIEGAPLDDTSVVDRVLIDPLTPGIYFSIYYSNDGEPGRSQDEWDQKLWTRVPLTFHALKRDTHVLPEPIQTKYIKIEFTHLQARPYSPGNFAKPVTYQKHPKWVLDYFLARTATAQATTSALDVGQVAVRFDAYDLAYNYYMDDLKQDPTPPFEIDKRFRSEIGSYLSSDDDLSDRLDPTMLDRIRVALTPYREAISTFVNPDTILGGLSKAAISTTAEYPLERDTISYADTQQLRNTSVVFENDYPVMFFFLTCRHAYRVIKAPFDNDKAFFAGIKEVAFTRENYTVAYDSDLYIEPHGDLVNTERNDFTQVEGSLVV